MINVHEKRTKMPLFEIEGKINVIGEPHDFRECGCDQCLNLSATVDEFLGEVDLLIRKRFSGYGGLNIKDSVVTK